MSKQSTKAASLSTDVQTIKTDTAPVLVLGGPKPSALYIIGSTPATLAQLVVLARVGYTVNLDRAADIFPEAGTIGLHLVLGSPEAGIVEAANATVREGMAQQQGRYEADVQAAARQLLADEAKARKEAEVQAVIAETQARIKELQASLQA